MLVRPSFSIGFCKDITVRSTSRLQVVFSEQVIYQIVNYKLLTSMVYQLHIKLLLTILMLSFSSLIPKTNNPVSKFKLYYKTSILYYSRIRQISKNPSSLSVQNSMVTNLTQKALYWRKHKNLQMNMEFHILKLVHWKIWMWRMSLKTLSSRHKLIKST